MLPVLVCPSFFLLQQCQSCVQFGLYGSVCNGHCFDDVLHPVDGCLEVNDLYPQLITFHDEMGHIHIITIEHFVWSDYHKFSPNFRIGSGMNPCCPNTVWLQSSLLFCHTPRCTVHGRNLPNSNSPHCPLALPALCACLPLLLLAHFF